MTRAPTRARRRPARAAATLAAAGLAATAGAGCLSRPSYDCELAVDATRITGQIGTSGGVPHDPMTCGARPVIGVGITLTRAPNAMYGEQTAITAWLRCATVANHDGAYAPRDVEDVAAPGGGETDVDGPFFAECPRGQIAVGISAHLVGPTSLFNSLSLQCAIPDPAGAPSPAVTTIAAPATGSAPTSAEARCNAGDALRGLRTYSGRELDRVELVCGLPSCALPP